MAASLGCNTTRVLYNAPAPGTRNAGEASTSSISRLHLRGRRANKGLSLKLAGRQRAKNGTPLVCASLSNESDKVRDLASEKAVESGQQVAEDSKKFANGQNPVVLDAKSEDASDAASYESDVREGVVDVASDMAVDTTDDVDALAAKDAVPLADTYGRSVEDTAEALEAKAEEVSSREASKEKSVSQGNSGSFFKDQVVKEEMLDVASSTAVDEGAEVEATAQKDAADMTSKVGGDLRRNKMTIEGLADTASKLEADRAGGLQQFGDQLEGLKRTISKNLKEGIDSNRPGLEELSRTASMRVKAGREYLDDASEGASDISEDAQTVLEDAKGALDKRQSAINLAVADASETGSMVADLAVKGWAALSKTTEKFVAKFQKNAGEFQVKAQEKAEEAKQRAEVTADQAQSKFAEAKLKAEAATDQAQKQFAEAKSTLQDKTDELKEAAQERTSESRANLEKAIEDAQRKFNEAKDNLQAKSGELKDTAEEKASESKFKLENTAEAAQSKAGELSSSAKEKIGDAQGNVESKVGDVSKDLSESTGQTEGSARSMSDPIPGDKASAPYADSGKINDEWKGKAQ